MNLLRHIDATFATHLTWTLLHFVWQGLLVAFLVAVLRQRMRNASANARYVVGVAALVAMAACLPATFVATAGRSPGGEPREIETAAAVSSPVNADTVSQSHAADVRKSTTLPQPNPADHQAAERSAMNSSAPQAT
jgi:hypothetical protein